MNMADEQKDERCARILANGKRCNVSLSIHVKDADVDEIVGQHHFIYASDDDPVEPDALTKHVAIAVAAVELRSTNDGRSNPLTEEQLLERAAHVVTGQDYDVAKAAIEAVMSFKVRA